MRLDSLAVVCCILFAETPPPPKVRTRFRDGVVELMTMAAMAAMAMAESRMSHSILLSRLTRLLPI